MGQLTSKLGNVVSIKVVAL